MGAAYRIVPGSHRTPERRSATTWLWLGNVLLGTFIGLAYLDGQRCGESVRLWLYAHLGLISTIATLSLGPLALTWCLSRARLSEIGFAVGQSLVWMSFQVLLVIDTHVYGLFRYHLNSAAWNLVTTRGSEDSFELGPKIWLVGFGFGAAFFSAEWLAWSMLIVRRRRARMRATLRKLAWIGAALVLLSICIEKSIYAQADLAQDRSVAALSLAFPMYTRLNVVTILPEPLKEEIGALPEVPVIYDRERLAYPRSQPRIPPGSPRPNVLIVVVDSWRRDMLREDVTPHLSRFAEGSLRFDDHLSGGNGTRFGVFSMLYGLHGSYWWPVLEARRAPVLLQLLGQLGYERRVYSSASMDYPEFRQTAWVDIADAVHDDFGARRQSDRDRLVIEQCIQWLETRDRERPFFGFVLLDSAHQKYDFPEEDAQFLPYAPDVDYLEMAGSQDPELVRLVRNRYMNALHHVDNVAHELLEQLDRMDALDDTVVIVTGDHGEEFAENGYWGHTGNFTAEQIAVPFLLRAPGVAAGVERRPTSHVDVATTLLELLGAPPAERGEWCNGASLLDPHEHRARVVAGWEEIGLVTDSGTFRIPREASPSVGARVCDARWQLVADQRGAFARESAALRGLVEECARFLDLPADVARR